MLYVSHCHPVETLILELTFLWKHERIENKLQFTTLEPKEVFIQLFISYLSNYPVQKLGTNLAVYRLFRWAVENNERISNEMHWTWKETNKDYQDP